MTQERPKYLAYLLRLWQVQDEQGATWRVSLEDVNTRVLRGFGSLEKAFVFLCEHTIQHKEVNDDTE